MIQDLMDDEMVVPNGLDTEAQQAGDVRHGRSVLRSRS